MKKKINLRQFQITIFSKKHLTLVKVLSVAIALMIIILIIVVVVKKTIKVLITIIINNEGYLYLPHHYQIIESLVSLLLMEMEVEVEVVSQEIQLLIVQLSALQRQEIIQGIQLILLHQQQAHHHSLVQLLIVMDRLIDNPFKMIILIC